MKVEVISQQDPDDPAKPVAMCVEFDYADKDKVMVPSFWPQGMRVRGWFLKKKKSWSTYYYLHFHLLFKNVKICL